MIVTIFRLLSHLLFIYLAHDLLITAVDWSKLMRSTAENKRKIQLLLLFIAIGLGYMVSAFFLDLLDISRSLALTVSH